MTPIETDRPPKPHSFLYKDRNLAIINKPQKVSVEDCMSKLQLHLALSSFKRPGKEVFISPIAPLDKAVSGIQVFGLNTVITQELEKVWYTERVQREYLALVKGDIQTSGLISFQLDHQEAVNNTNAMGTRYTPIKSYGIATYLRVWNGLESRHQIRRHFSRRCMNVIGDKKFGQQKINRHFEELCDLKRIFLHAHYLKIHLKSYNRPLEVSCPLPADLRNPLEMLNCCYHPGNTMNGYCCPQVPQE